MRLRVRDHALALLATFTVACSQPHDTRDGSVPGDGGRDAGGSVPDDAGVDSGAGIDAGASDAGPPLRAAPLLRWPVNGAYTGSLYVPLDAAVVDHPLRPKLMWAPVERATDYQVQLDDCGGDFFRTCAFASPELDERTAGEPAPTGDALQLRPAAALPVAAAAPVGRRYVWRVRACNAGGCGDWSEHRYLHVGRHEDDFNGDGYADLVVGANGQSNPQSSEGNAFVYYGGPGGLGADRSPNVVLDNPADHAGGYFGHSVASAGDLNGDGYADLVVGAFQQNNPESYEGNAFVYYGGPGGLGADPSPDVVLDNPTDQANGYFGSSVASAGDLNGDGYADLAVGAYAQSNPEFYEGNAFVYYGGPGGLGTNPSPDVVLDNPADEAASRFGRSVASAGDLNGDGYADLAVGAAERSDPEGREGNAFVYYGGPGGLGIDPSPDVVLDNPADQVLGFFGSSIASAGDVNGDGYADLAVGTDSRQNPESTEGNAFVYYGGPGGLSADPSPDVVLDNPTDQVNGSFGWSVASAGDVNGDGYADLVVGANGQDNPENAEGNAFLYYGGPDGLDADPDPDVVLDNPADQGGGNFGFSVASGGDLNGDGYADLVVGAYTQGNPEGGEGNAFVYYGGSGGLGVDPSPDVVLDNPADQANGNFGRSVASAAEVHVLPPAWRVSSPS